MFTSKSFAEGAPRRIIYIHAIFSTACALAGWRCIHILEKNRLSRGRLLSWNKHPQANYIFVHCAIIIITRYFKRITWSLIITQVQQPKAHRRVGGCESLAHDHRVRATRACAPTLLTKCCCVYCVLVHASASFFIFFILLFHWTCRKSKSINLVFSRVIALSLYALI